MGFDWMKSGAQVRYIGTDDFQVAWGNCADPRGVLKQGEVYTVDEVQSHPWHMKFFLVGFPNKGFNSVCFENAPAHGAGEKGEGGDG